MPTSGRSTMDEKLTYIIEDDVDALAYWEDEED